MKKGKKITVIIGVVIIAIAVIFVGYLGLKSSLTYYYEVNELLAKGSGIYDKNVKVGGEVLPGIERNVSLAQIKFQIVDLNDLTTAIDVVYHGSQVPDTFKEAVHVIVEGKYTGEGVFEATSIITKCSSKYIPETATGVSQ